MKASDPSMKTLEAESIQGLFVTPGSVAFVKASGTCNHHPVRASKCAKTRDRASSSEGAHPIDVAIDPSVNRAILDERIPRLAAAL